MGNIVRNTHYQRSGELFSYATENLRLTQELQQSQEHMSQAMSQKFEELNQAWEARYKAAEQKAAEEKAANDIRIARLEALVLGRNSETVVSDQSISQTPRANGPVEEMVDHAPLRSFPYLT